MPSLSAALQIAFPNHPWQVERFKENMRRRKWADIKAQREFLELIAPQLGVKQVLTSPQNEICCLIPSLKTVERLVFCLPQRYWATGRKETLFTLFFTARCSEINLSRTQRCLHGRANAGIKIQPRWLYHQSGRTIGNPTGEILTNQFLILFSSLFQKPSDWYSVTLADLKEIGASASLSKIKLAEALEERYPGFEWEKVHLLKGKFGQQNRLERLVAELFPVSPFYLSLSFSFFFFSEYPFRESRLWWMQEGRLIWSTLKPNTLSSWISSFLPLILHLSIKFVYFPSSTAFLSFSLSCFSVVLFFLFLTNKYFNSKNKDKSHYIGIESYNRTIEQIKEIDHVKRQLAKDKGITLIPVPCWWDGTKSRYQSHFLRSFC